MLPYWPVVRHPVLRRVLPGLTVSALGDGMSLVAVSWLALALAPPESRPTWVALAVAAYALPSALGALLFAPVLRHRSGAQLAGWDATLRALCLGAIPVAYALGGLSMMLYVVLLALSSLLGAWGSAGRYTLVAEVLPREHHLPANALLNLIAEAATLVGPPLAGVLIAVGGAPTVIAIDAASFSVLALTYRFAAVPDGPARNATASRVAGFAVIRRDRQLLGLLALSFFFFFFYGPVLVALPVHIAEDLHGPATLLGVYYTAFGVGAVLGGLVAGYLRRWRLWPTTIGVVLGFGAALLPLGLGVPVWAGLVALAVGGLVWAPYPSTTTALFQRVVPTDLLPRVLAGRGAVLVVAAPLGTVLGGPSVAAFGARQTLLLCAVGTIALGGIAATVALATRARTTARPATPSSPPSAPG